MLEVIAVQGSAVARWWYMLYGFVGVVYGQGVGETPVPPVVPPKLVPMLPVSIVPVPIPAATEDADELKQLMEF